MRGVDVGVRFMPAGRAPEHVPLANPRKPAPGAGPARIGRVHLGHAQATNLCLVLDSDADFPPLPKRETAAQGPAANLSLLGMRYVPQILEEEDSINWSPLCQGCSCLPGEGFGSVALLATKPFEHTTDASGILMLCLSGRELALKARTGLLSSAVGYLDSPAGDKKGTAVGVHRDKRIGFIQIDAYRHNARWFRDLQCHGHAAKQPSVSLNDGETVDLFSLPQCRSEYVRHRVRKALASGDGPDGQRTVSAKVGIPATFADQEECSRPWKAKGREI